MEALSSILSARLPQFQTHQALVVIGLQEDFIAPSGRLPVPTDSGFLERIKAMVPRFREGAGEIIWVRTVHDRKGGAKDDVEQLHETAAASVVADPPSHIDSADEADEPAAPSPPPVKTPTLRSKGSQSVMKGLLKKMSSRKALSKGDAAPAPSMSHERELSTSSSRTGTPSVVDDELFLSPKSSKALCCERHSPGAEFASAIKSLIVPKSDIVVTIPRYSAFDGTNLLTTLRGRFITQLYLCGCLSNIQLYATAHDAAQHGLQLNIVVDCLGYRTASRHTQAVGQLSELMGATLLESGAILSDLAEPTESEKKREMDAKEIEGLLGGMDVNVKGDPRPPVPSSYAPTSVSAAQPALASALPDPPSSAASAASASAVRKQAVERDPASMGASGGANAKSATSKASSVERYDKDDDGIASSRPTSASGSAAAEGKSRSTKNRVRMRNRRTKQAEQATEPQSSTPPMPPTQLPQAATDIIEAESPDEKPAPPPDAIEPVSSSPPLSPCPSTSKAKQNLPAALSIQPGKPPSQSPLQSPKRTTDPEELREDEVRAKEALALLEGLEKDVGRHESIGLLVEMIKEHKKRIGLEPDENQGVGGASGNKVQSDMVKVGEDSVSDEEDTPQTYGSGDSYLVSTLISPSLTCFGQQLADHMFTWLYNEVHWQTMYHQTGSVPRLVCAQGAFGRDVGHSDGRMPVYRHPSDYSLPLLHFSPTVQMVREEAAKRVGHELNHCLIQLYRSGNDYISEHSDKTLDVVHGSSIVNASFGAQRTMRLRTKRAAKREDISSPALTSTPSVTQSPHTPTDRETQRIPLPHNSLFILGQASNATWLHSIQPDKRLARDRGAAELAFGGMRISLTFRHIGTFLSADSGRIWGQGATRKAYPGSLVVNGDERKTEEVVRAFGKENLGPQAGFEWGLVYGSGFDVLHFRTSGSGGGGAAAERRILFLGDGPEENEEVCAALQAVFGADKGGCEVVELPERLSATLLGAAEDGKGVGGAAGEVEARKVCLRDTDPNHTEVEGAKAILLYLNRYR